MAIGLAAGALLLPDWTLGRRKDNFEWSVNWEGATPLAAGTTTPRTFQVDANADAFLLAVTGVISAAGAFTLPVGIVPVKLTIKDTGSGRDLMNAAVAWGAIVGTGERPGYLFPKFIPRSSTVEINAENLDAANAWDIHLTFLGLKVWPSPEQTPG